MKKLFPVAAGVTMLLALLVLAGLSLGTTPQSAAQPPLQPVSPEVLDALETEPWVEVIVALRQPPAAEAAPLDLPTLVEQVTASQDGVLSGLTQADFQLLHRYQAIPALLGRVSGPGLDKLAPHSDVVSVHLDAKVRATLAESVPLINADDVHSLGFTGAGVTVAVIDSGIDTDHPDLQDDLVAEHCYLKTATCPCGGHEAHGSGCAEDGRGHGSHVSGIITSGGMVAPVGVAPDAGIIAFKTLPDSGSGWASDTLKAVDYIITHPGDGVDIVNMSVGSGPYTAPCDSDFEEASIAFSTLRNAGVIPFASSGNDGDKARLNMPACIASVVSVGAVYDADVGPITWYTPDPDCVDQTTAPDKIACASNSSSELDLLAPGAMIESSWNDGGTESKKGTSQATPHAAGCAALFLQANPTLTPAQIENRLEASSVMVEDTNNQTKPRIDCYPLPNLAPPCAWTAPASLNTNAATDTGPDYGPEVTTDGTTWVAVWDSDSDLAGGTTDRNILFSRSTDAGATWSAPAFLNTNHDTDSGGDYAPQVTTDGAAHWVAVWQSRADLGGTIGTDSDILVSRYPDNGTAWSAPAALNTNAPTDVLDDYGPQVTTDGAGNWVAVWYSIDNLGGTIGTDSDILVARSTDNGFFWTDPAPLNTNAPTDSGDDFLPQVTTDAAGNWVAVWSSGENLGGTIGTDRDILVSRSTDNGFSWTDPAPLNTNAPTDSGTDNLAEVTTDGTGNWVAVWRTDDDLGGTIGTDRDILVSRSTDNGFSWTDPAPLNTNATSDSGYDDLAQVTTDGAGNWLAVWYSNENLGVTIGWDYDILVARSTDNGATWNAPVPLNTNAATDSGPDYDPQVTTDGAGNWVAVWYSEDDLEGTTGADIDILYATDEAACEKVEEPVPDDGTVTTDPEEDGATAGDPVETTVTTPNAGIVSISEGPISAAPPAGFTFLGLEVSISAPIATADEPLTILLRLDASIIPEGEDENTIEIFKDGEQVPVAACTGAPGEADPDPCVSARERLGDGDVQITILTSTASKWSFGVSAQAAPTPTPTPTPTPPPGTPVGGLVELHGNSSAAPAHPAGSSGGSSSFPHAALAGGLAAAALVAIAGGAWYTRRRFSQRRIRFWRRLG